MTEFLKVIRNTRHPHIILLFGLILAGLVANSGNTISAARILFYFLVAYLLFLGRKHRDWGQLLVGGKTRRIFLFFIPLLGLLFGVFWELFTQR